MSDKFETELYTIKVCMYMYVEQDNRALLGKLKIKVPVTYHTEADIKFGNFFHDLSISQIFPLYGIC